MNKDSWILVVGAGSIGERHISVLQSLGYCNIVVLRTRNIAMRSVAADQVRIVTTWEDAAALAPAAAIICTPTSLHLEQSIRCLEMGFDVLVEKPLHHELAGLEKLETAIKKTSRYLQVAYMLRYHPHMLMVKQWADGSTKLGKMLNANTYWGEYLPHWHPWEDYRDGYAARKALGGGAALTLSHDLDLLCHLAGAAVQHFNRMQSRAAHLEVDTDSATAISLAFANGSLAQVYLSYQDVSPRRTYHFTFQHGAATVDYYANTLTKKVYDQATAQFETEVKTLEGFDRNDMFRAQWLDFVEKACLNDTALALQNITDTKQVLNLCLGAA